jgi:CheY-like chemotaxis protein
MAVVKRPSAKPRSLRILHADDDQDILYLLDSFLQRHEYIVATASDGEEALQKLLTAAPPFDVLLTDTHMPLRNGQQLIAAAKESGFQGVCIVFSASLTNDDIAAFRALGVTDIVIKPNLAALAAILRAHALSPP